MIRLTKKEREIKEKLAEINKNLHYARIYMDQKAYQSASVCAKCAVQLIDQVDAAIYGRKTK